MQNKTQIDHACPGIGSSLCGRCEDWPEETKARQGGADADNLAYDYDKAMLVTIPRLLLIILVPQSWP